MNARALVALLLCGLLASVDSTIIIAGTTATVGTVAAAAAYLGLGALAVLKGAVIGSALARGKRDVSQQEEDQSVEMALDIAQQIDSAGCVAKLLCELEAMPTEQLSPALSALKGAFGDPNSVDFLKQKTSHGFYALAASFGAKLAKNDPKACDRLFDSCPVGQQELFLMAESVLACH